MNVVVFLFLVHAVIAVTALQYGEILFVLLTQKHPYHESLAGRLKQNILNQVRDEEKVNPTVLLSNEHGSWTILPQISSLYEKYYSSHKWVVFCEDHTALRVKGLRNILNEYDHKDDIWLGYGLKDTEPTIIHHFELTHSKFLFPNFGSGFAMSMGLLQTVNMLRESNKTMDISEFSIDPSYELAKHLYSDGPEIRLTHRREFCVVSAEFCATYPKTYESCGGPVPLDNIFFAVKTYHEFHESRVRVVKRTWGKYLPYLLFVSDKNDSFVPTVDLGIPNTDKGHCAKTLAIIDYLSKNLDTYPTIKWLVIADDDTILSVARLSEIIPCFGNKKVALGERYGYNLWKGKMGYDYLTGGGGFVLSIDLLPKLANCTCPSISSPDDMWLGICLDKLKVRLVHSSLFHQGRPMDYPPEYLAPHHPVSFHKHWMINPDEVYEQWFKKDDSKFVENFIGNQLRHIEL